MLKFLGLKLYKTTFLSHHFWRYKSKAASKPYLFSKIINFDGNRCFWSSWSLRIEFCDCISMSNSNIQGVWKMCMLKFSNIFWLIVKEQDFTIFLTCDFRGITIVIKRLTIKDYFESFCVQFELFMFVKADLFNQFLVVRTFICYWYIFMILIYLREEW